MHGPCGDALHFCPDFAEGGKIRLIDDVARTISPLRPARRKRWRRARDAALAAWEQAGIRFMVEEGPGARYSYYDPANPKDTYVTPLVVPGAIRLVRNITRAPEDTWQRQDFALYYAGGAVAAIDLEKKITDPLYEWPRVTCHELGHCLGLEHGGQGVMGGGLEPGAHDLASVRDYYLGEA